MKAAISLLAATLAAGMLAGPALAQQAQPLPEWDQLAPEQREALVSTVRDRWNNSPERRAHMLRHAERWQQMTPEERRSARHGMKRWHDMSPERREEARALFQHMRGMPAAEREALRARWKTMSAEERRAWLERHRPAE